MRGESKKRYVHEKAKAISNIIDMIVDQDTNHGKDLEYCIFRKVGEDRDLLVLGEKNLKLYIEDVVTLRDVVGI